MNFLLHESTSPNPHSVSLTNNEEVLTTIVDGGRIRAWVGFGWITTAQAQAEDYLTRPVRVN